MSEIRGLMQFTAAEIESTTTVPSEKDPTTSLVLSADFTADIAERMGIRASVYREDGSPHPGATRMDLGEKKLRDIDLSLPAANGSGAYDWFRPELIYGFRIDRESEDNPQLRIHMRIRLKRKAVEVAEFVEAINKDDFEFAIRALQAEFDWSGAGGTGTSVDMSAGREPREGRAEASGPLFSSDPITKGKQIADVVIAASGGRCAFCDRGVPKNSDGFHMSGDELAPCITGGSAAALRDMSNAEPVPDEPQRGPALVDSRDMGHRRNKRQLTRGDVAAQERGEGEDPVIPVEDEPAEVIQ